MPHDTAHAVQHARLTIRAGKRTRIAIDVTVTGTGLLAIGALVSSILLSSAVVVRAARRPRPMPVDHHSINAR